VKRSTPKRTRPAKAQPKRKRLTISVDAPTSMAVRDFVGMDDPWDSIFPSLPSLLGGGFFFGAPPRQKTVPVVDPGKGWLESMLGTPLPAEPVRPPRRGGPHCPCSGCRMERHEW